MTSIVFDTLKFARALRDKAKLTNEQAEGFADAIAEALHDDLATKADLQLLKSDLRVEIESAKSDLRVEIESAKSEIIKWMFGTIGFQTIIILGAVVALARLAK
jgi:hypothetical protein